MVPLLNRPEVRPTTLEGDTHLFPRGLKNPSRHQSVHRRIAALDSLLNRQLGLPRHDQAQ